MTNKHKTLALWVLGGALLVAMTAGASAYITKNSLSDEAPAQKVKSERITWNEPRHNTAQRRAQQPAQTCDDANIVGTAIGAVAGGVVGNQVGGGKGKDLATIGGAIGGGYLGNQYIPTRNALCN